MPVVGVLLAFAPAVLGLRTLSQRDTDLLYGPLRTLVAEALRDGRLPLWNPYEATGKPLFAEGIHSVLHPVSIAGAFVAPTSVDFLILAYLAAAGLGTFLLSRTLGASPAAAAGAGLALALSGPAVSMSGNLVFLAGLATLPWLLAASRVAGAGARWGVVLVALAAASAFFSGDVQVTLVGGALGLLLAADAGGPRGALRALLGCALGALLAGVQIASTHALLGQTHRGVELLDWERTRWALVPWRLLEWIVPGLFRGPLAVVPAGASGDWLDPVFADSVYLGAPLVAAALLGALGPSPVARRRTGLLLGGAGVVLLWLALGHHLGARQFLDWVPVWNRFRYTEKLMAPLALCLFALGALGIDAFAARRPSRTWTLGLGLGVAGALLALTALRLAPEATGSIAARLLGDAGPFYRSTLAAGLPHLLVALGALLAADRLRHAPGRTAALALLVAIAPAAAIRYGAHLGLHATRRPPEPLRLEADSPSPRLAHTEAAAYDRSGSPDFVEWAARRSALLLEPAMNAARRVDTFEPYGAFEPHRLTTLAASYGAPWARSFRRFALTHVVVPVPADGVNPRGTALALEGARLVQSQPSPGFELWAVPHRPWTFFPQRAIAIERPEHALDLTLDLTARGDDATVVVEAALAPATGPGRVLRMERGTEWLAVEAEAPGPALLVVQDAWWPGWRATIDGQEAEILAADLLVRAVPWPAGRHRLVMTYDPPELRLGLALSTLGAVLVLLAVARAARRARPEPRPPGAPPHVPA